MLCYSIGNERVSVGRRSVNKLPRIGPDGGQPGESGILGIYESMIDLPRAILL